MVTPCSSHAAANVKIDARAAAERGLQTFDEIPLG